MKWHNPNPFSLMDSDVILAIWKRLVGEQYRLKILKSDTMQTLYKFGNNEFTSRTWVFPEQVT